MPVLYPSQEWCNEWKKAINDNPAISEMGKNWGVDFNGNWVFEIQSGGGLEKTSYVYLEAKNGKCTDARLINDPTKVVAGFYAVGSYDEYKEVVKGKKDFIEGAMKGVFKLKGDMTHIMRHAKFIRAVANSISSFEATYLGE